MAKLGFSWHLADVRGHWAVLQHSLNILGLSSIFPFFLSYYHSLAFWSPFALQQLNSFLAFLSSRGDLLCRVSHFHCLSVAYCHPRKLACIADVI